MEKKREKNTVQIGEVWDRLHLMVKTNLEKKGDMGSYVFVASKGKYRWGSIRDINFSFIPHKDII